MLRPLHEQVVVITGASSGIGRETAIQFGRRGASVVLAARNQAALDAAAQEVERAGGRAHIAVTDVSEWEQVDRLAQTAIDQFGRIDTLVNNAALYFVGPVEAMTIEEIERIFQVNTLGQIYGIKAVLPHFIQQGQGTIISVASALGVRAAPWLGAYSASKHAIKGFVEALRMELKRDHPGIQVTLVLPASINTPFFTHGRSKIGVKPHPLPPIYEPRVVAEAILFAAEHPRRDIYVGPGRGLAIMEGLSPGLVDRSMVLGDMAFRLQQTNEPDDGQDNFFAPMPLETYTTTGEWGQESTTTSRYTRYVELHPMRQLAVLGGALLGGFMLARRIGR